jgi:hypothetical protein
LPVVGARRTVKEHMRGQQQSEQLERTLRRVLREELASSQTD